MKKYFTHKILPILGLMFFIIFILFITNSYASVDTAAGVYKDFPSQFNDTTHEIVLINHGSWTSNDHYLAVPKDSGYFYVESSVVKFKNTSGSTIVLYSGEYNNGWIVRSENFTNNSIKNWGEMGVDTSDEGNFNTDRKRHIIFCNTIVYNGLDGKDNNNIYFTGNIKPVFEITVSTTEDTTSPIEAYSNWFSTDKIFNYECYISDVYSEGISLSDLHFNKMSISTLTDTSTNTTKCRFFYRILENGTYIFKLINKETNEEKLATLTVTNILSINSSNGSDSNGIPIPHITYKRYGDKFSLRTQGLNKEDIQKYTCYYVKMTDDLDISNISTIPWQKMGIGTFTNTQINETEYYYFLDVPTNSENCTYLFVFYDNTLNLYGNISTLTCDFTYMNDYADKVQESISVGNDKLDYLLQYFKQRFGFLTYPFEFISDFFKRILNINFTEPIIRIPELREPFYNYKIFNGVEFNFNSLLDNSFYLYLHNIYLVAVDFILIIGLIKVGFGLLMEVLSNE